MEEIWTIDMGDGFLDSDYTFYEDGRIKHFYDQSMYKPNQERWVEPGDLSESQKGGILERCPVDLRNRVQEILASM
jgi:hypothetical protein